LVAALVAAALYLDPGAPDLRDERRIAAGKTIYDGLARPATASISKDSRTGRSDRRTVECPRHRMTIRGTPGTTATTCCSRSRNSGSRRHTRRLATRATCRPLPKCCPTTTYGMRSPSLRVAGRTRCALDTIGCNSKSRRDSGSTIRRIPGSQLAGRRRNVDPHQVSDGTERVIHAFQDLTPRFIVEQTSADQRRVSETTPCALPPNPCASMRGIGPVPTTASSVSARTSSKARREKERPCSFVNYSRRALRQTGDGHFSPIGGYHAGSDRVLVLDTARFKYPPHWVPVELLFAAMQAQDGATGQSRGWLGLRARLVDRGAVFSNSPLQ